MTRLFVIFFEIFVLVMLLRSSFVQYFLNDMQHQISDWMTDISTVVEKRELAELREIISPYTHQMRDYQHDYVAEVTSQKVRLISFNQQLCVSGDKNPYVFGVNLKNICSAIQQTEILKH
jgi:hypothetical protein